MGTNEESLYYKGYGERPVSLRVHWINCCQCVDDEIEAIDRLEGELTNAEHTRALPIRQLISHFEICHWNSLRWWLERILEAIAEERVPPTSGRPRREHPLAQVLLRLRKALVSWLEQREQSLPSDTILDRTPEAVIKSLGTQTPFKVWVVQRVIENLDHHLRTNDLADPPAIPFAIPWVGRMMLDSPEADALFIESRPQLTKARQWILHIKDARGPMREHSLAVVLGALTPCNAYYFRFLLALFESLSAPKEHATLPSPFCGNIGPSRQHRYAEVINTLRQILDKPLLGSEMAESRVVAPLGQSSLIKTWLVASLEKTLREQIAWSPDMRSTPDTNSAETWTPPVSHHV